MCILNGMGKQEFKTNIEIVPEVFPIYRKLVGRFGARAAVSAGIVLLSQLTADQREKLIDQMLGSEPMPDSLTQQLDQAVSEAADEVMKATPKRKQGH